METRLRIITSKEYWVEHIDAARYNKIPDEEFAEIIVSLIDEAITLSKK